MMPTRQHGRKTRIPRLLAVFLVAALLAAVSAAPVAAQEPPEHPHMLLVHFEFDPEMGDFGALVGFHRCIDLAAGKALPLHAHHTTVHTGVAGGALFSAGHVVIPGAPLTPWADCAALTAALPIVFGS
jgi:hypothetical protein